MPEQPSLPGFEPVAESIDSLFFAILPDAAAATQIELLSRRLRSAHGLKGQPQERERLHITLHYLGGYAGVPPALLASARAAAAMTAETPFEIAFDQVASFERGQRSRPLVLRGGAGLAALSEFQQVLGNAMRKVGLGRWVTGKFTPHLTLLYDDRGIESPIERIAWTAREFVLVRSRVGLHRHEVLARWPLRA